MVARAVRSEWDGFRCVQLQERWSRSSSDNIDCRFCLSAVSHPLTPTLSRKRERDRYSATMSLRRADTITDVAAEILVLRSQRVMLDSTRAKLYGVTTR